MEVLYSIMLMSCLGDKDNSFIAASQLFGIKISGGSIVLPLFLCLLSSIGLAHPFII